METTVSIEQLTTIIKTTKSRTLKKSARLALRAAEKELNRLLLAEASEK